MQLKNKLAITLLLISIICHAQKNFSLTAQYGGFFTGFKDRKGEKIQVGVSYFPMKRLEVNVNYNVMNYQQEETFYAKENTFFYDIHPEKFPLPSLASPANQETIDKYGLIKLTPGYFHHYYRMTNIEVRYKILDRKFFIKGGFGVSYIKGNIVDIGRATDVMVESLLTEEKARARLVIPLLISYKDMGYVWSINIGYKINERTSIVSTLITHSSFTNSTGPVSTGVGLEVKL